MFVDIYKKENSEQNFVFLLSLIVKYVYGEKGGGT